MRGGRGTPARRIRPCDRPGTFDSGLCLRCHTDLRTNHPELQQQFDQVQYVDDAIATIARQQAHGPTLTLSMPVPESPDWKPPTRIL